MTDNIFSNFIQFIPQVKGQGFQQLNRGLMSTHRNLFSLRNMFGAFFGYDLYSSVRNLIPQLVNTSQQLGAMKSRFNAVSTSASAGADELNWIGEQSKRLGLDFLRTADDYSIFFATVSNNMGQGTTRKVFEQWAEAFRVLHIDPERQTRVLYALREMSSKGKIYMQDLALQLGSAVPDAMNLAAKAMGYTGPKAVEKFRAAIKAGNIDVKKFIPAFSAIINKQYVNADKLAYAMGQTDAQLQLINTHWQFMQKKLLESGMQDDIVNFLKGVNKLLGFLEAHASGLYKTLKLIGISLLAFAGVMTLINLPGTILAMAEMLTLLINIRKNLLLIQLMSAGMAGAAGIEAGAVAGILLFLTQPAIWVPLAIAALGAVLMFIIKKFFPNVWSSIMSIWVRLKILIWNLIDDINNHPAIQALKQWFGTEKKGFGKDVQDKQEAWKKITPNHEFIYNSVGFLEALGKKTYDLYNKFNPISLGVKTANIESRAIKHFIEQKYNIDIKVDGVEDKRIIMDSVNTALSNFAEQNKKKTAIDIINSKNNNRLPFTPLGSVH